MVDESTERFLRRLNEQNVAIAAREAEKEALRAKPDSVRLLRDQARRDKWGTLRARERPGKRVRRVSRVFPYVDPS